ncbi:MAG: Lcl C-terminal domain-containing protein [Syntrophales bacterium]
MRKFFIALSVLILSFSMVSTVRADLFDMGDGTVYDTDTNITWYKHPNNNPMTWDAAMKWVAGLTVGGHRDWRLPTTPGTVYGYTNEGEMGRLYFDTLGNGEDGPLANKGPLSNIQPYDYWSGTEFQDDPANYAWAFDFRTGRQRSLGKNSIAYAIAVRSGGSNVPRSPSRGSGSENLPKRSPEGGGDKSSY